MEKPSNNQERKESGIQRLKSIGARVVETANRYLNTPYFIAPVPGAAIAEYYARLEAERIENARLEAEERLIVPSDLIGFDDEDETHIFRGLE